MGTLTHLANGPWKKSLNFIFPTKYVIPKSLSRGAIGQVSWKVHQKNLPPKNREDFEQFNITSINPKKVNKSNLTFGEYHH